MASGRGSRADKVRRIFERFDADGDGGLSRDEMAQLVEAVNPRVRFSSEQIQAILDEVFRTYAAFILPGRGLSLDGLLRTYDDGAGDVDRDFMALQLAAPLDDTSDDQSLAEDDAKKPASLPPGSSSLLDDHLIVSRASPLGAAAPAASSSRAAAAPRWAASPNHGIVFDSSWALLADVELLVRRLRSKQRRRAGGGEGNNNGQSNNFDSFSEAGWSREMGGGLGAGDSAGGAVVWDETTRDYLAFVKELAVLRSRADSGRSREEAFDNHMTVGRALYEHRLFRDALISFRRACELQPTDVRAHFRAGNCLYALGRYAEAKEEFLLALEAAEAGGSQSADILPQIHVNLGISFEAEGMLLSASEHYREAAILSPSHFRALKLLGSALFGVGEYHAAEKALEEAIFLQPDYEDAHCDLGSALHAMGDDERAIQEFQKAIDLKPGHVDALYNLGGLNMDAGRFQRAAEMYTRVLSIRPSHWRAQLNKAVALLGQGEQDEARRALNEAFKMTPRVELYDAIAHLKVLHKKKRARPKGGAGTTAEDGNFLIVDPSRFKRIGRKTTPRQDLAHALDIRAFQRASKLNSCNVELLRSEMSSDVPVSYSGTGVPEKSIRKAALEAILRRLLHALRPETFQAAIRAINERVLTVLDASGSGRVDLGMFLAVIAPICSGPTDRRKKIVFDALLWRPSSEGAGHVKRSDALAYIKLLRAIYIPSHGVSEMLEMHGESDPSSVSYQEFLEMFNDADWGFGIISTLARLEEGDRIRHGRHTCSICRYPIIGARFKEMKHGFSLCSRCYSEGKVPRSLELDEYQFKEYGRESEAAADSCMCINLHKQDADA